MRIESFTEAKNMPEKYLPSLVDAEIECWGSEPFSEFRICKNNECKAVFSIEDVYGSVEEFQKKRDKGELNNDFCCEECGEKTRYVYEKGDFLELFENYFKGNVSSILLLNEIDIVRGFGVVSKKTINELIETELNTRPSSYSKNELLNNLSKNIFGTQSAGNMSVIYFNHLFVGEEVRNERYGGMIMQRMLKFIKFYNDIPSVIETKKNSNIYYFMKRAGYADGLEDKFGYIVMYLNQHSCSFRAILKTLSSTKNDFSIINFLKNSTNKPKEDRFYYN